MMCISEGRIVSLESWESCPLEGGLPSELESDVSAIRLLLLSVPCEKRGTGGRVRGELSVLFRLVDDDGADNAY